MRKIPSLILSALLMGQSFAQDLYDETTVRDLKLTFHQSNYWALLDQNRQSETCIEADLEVDGVLYTQVGVRFKGNSSASVWPEEKMPFKIKMDEYVADQELYGFDTINLGNAFMDPTFCREVVTYHVLREYLPAPRANFARLWINGTYWGIYNNTEQVSGEFLAEWFDDNDGNRYKCDPVTGGGPGGGGNKATLT
ncbi:MAG: CotH kinase family protein, partial [Planctomycetota bacterium]|nr:CotH kinase family protein [Planctomycetota bacterium]